MTSSQAAAQAPTLPCSQVSLAFSIAFSTADLSVCTGRLVSCKDPERSVLWARQAASLCSRELCKLHELQSATKLSGQHLGGG